MKALDIDPPWVVLYEEGGRYILLASIWCVVLCSTRFLPINPPVISRLQADFISCLCSTGAYSTHSPIAMQMLRRKRMTDTLTNLLLTPHPHTHVYRHTTAPSPRRHHLPITTDYLLQQQMPVPPSSRPVSPPSTISREQAQAPTTHQHIPLHLQLPPAA
jgi:hypothetical protein